MQARMNFEGKGTSSSSSFLIKNILNLSAAEESRGDEFRKKETAISRKQAAANATEVQLTCCANYLRRGDAEGRCGEQVVDLRVNKPINIVEQHCFRFQIGVGIETAGSKSIKQSSSDANEQVAAEEKRQRTRTMFSDWQLASLEWRFAKNKYLTASDRTRIAKMLQLNQLQVKTWFQVSSKLLRELLIALV